jgi:hypothetical protein
MESAGTGQRRRMTPVMREGERVTPLELFFDLVFVLAITQCTALMVESKDSWEAVAEAMLVLALLWWAWTAYAWLTSVVDPEEGAVRIALFAAMAALLLAAPRCSSPVLCSTPGRGSRSGRWRSRWTWASRTSRARRPGGWCRFISPSGTA